MTTKSAKKFAEQMLNDPKLKSAQKFVILGLDRNKPGLGDDALLVDRRTGGLRFFDGTFQRGTRLLKDEAYRTICDEYLENGWADGDSGEDDMFEAEDDPDEDLDDPDADRAGYASTVIVPEGARSMVPGTEVEISYGYDGDGLERSSWPSDSYRIDAIEPPYDLAFHTNVSMDGIMLDEDCFDLPLVCWNTGDSLIKVDGQKVPAGDRLILLPSAPKRRERRLRYMDIMSLPIWDSEAKIARNAERLLASGCPAEDARALAGYFWRSSIYGVEDYDPADHAAWMDEVSWEGKPRPQS